jgi:hypothetical protein
MDIEFLGPEAAMPEMGAPAPHSEKQGKANRGLGALVQALAVGSLSFLLPKSGAF